MKATQKVKVKSGGMAGAVGEVLKVNEEEMTAEVYVSGVVNGIQVQGTETMPWNILEVVA